MFAFLPTPIVLALPGNADSNTIPVYIWVLLALVIIVQGIAFVRGRFRRK